MTATTTSQSQHRSLSMALGMPLSIQLRSPPGAQRLNARLLGLRQDHSILAYLTGQVSTPDHLALNDEVVVRFASGRAAYAFATRVIRISGNPYLYFI